MCDIVLFFSQRSDEVKSGTDVSIKSVYHTTTADGGGMILSDDGISNDRKYGMYVCLVLKYNRKSLIQS